MAKTFTVNLDEFDNVVLYEAEAGAVIPTLNLAPNVLIADPPRSGLAPAVHDAISKLQPSKSPISPAIQPPLQET
jgi:tRNA/tmRNA/rRNA uracil-C5-methylase (TrmA/RlmC/RlmD family)